MKIFTSILLLSVALFSSSLTRSGNYVIDDTHRLMWQDAKDNVRIVVTQEKANEYCVNLSFSGFRDWRLPSIEEYTTIIDKSRTKVELMIDKSFRYAIADDYWTSDRTWIRNFGQYGYYVFFKSGAIYYQNRTYPKYVRCVRSLK